MTQCARCGKRRLFLKLNQDSLCDDCVAQLEAERAAAEAERKRKAIEEATEFISTFSEHAKIAFENTYVYPSDGTEKISRIMRECKYIEEHASDWNQYEEFHDAFVATLYKNERGYTSSPLFPGKILWQQDDKYVEKCFADIKEQANTVYHRALSASLRAYDYRRHFRIVGVTFKNGRKSRQTILRAIKFEKPPFDKELEIKLETEVFEGEDAVGVYANDEKVGSISRDDLPWLLEHWDECSHIDDYSVYGGYGDHNFGMEIFVAFRYKNQE